MIGKIHKLARAVSPSYSRPSGSTSLFFRSKKLALKNKTIFLVIILLALNIFSYFWLPGKIDTTARGTFTLSPATAKTINNLNDTVSIKVFASSNLPSRFLQIKQNLKDLLEEYRWLGKGKIKVSWVAPDKDKLGAQEAGSLGIPQVQFSNLSQDQFQVSQGTFGVAVMFKDKKAIIPLVNSEANLEYDLTSRLAKVTQEKQPVIGLVTGHQEAWENPTNSGQEPLINQVLAQEFLVENFNLESGSAKPIPEQFNALIVAGPKNSLDTNNQLVIDQFLLAGKPIIFFVDGIEVSSNLVATQARHNLFNLLGKYGLTLKKDLVLDQSAEIANFSTGLTTFFVSYPYWVKVLPQGIDQKNPATYGLNQLLFPWTSSIEYQESDKRITPLIYSSEKSWSQSEKFNLDPTQKWQPGNQKPQLLAVLFQGQLGSVFSPDKLPKEFDKEFIKKTPQAKFVLVADSGFINENITGRYPANWYFLLNLVEFLTFSQNLAQIQVKQQTLAPLKDTGEQQKEIIKYGNIIGLPLMVSFLGLGYLFWRARQKFSL